MGKAPWTVQCVCDTVFRKNDYNKKVFRFIENRDYNESAYWWIYNNCCCMISPFSYYVNKINVIELAEREGIKTPRGIG